MEIKTLKTSDWVERKGAKTSRIVLTTWNETTPFVTHIEMEDGSKLAGNYFRKIDDALLDFYDRADAWR